MSQGQLYTTDYLLMETDNEADDNNGSGVDDVDEDNELPPTDNIVIIDSVDRDNYSRWNHLSDLDEFFTRIYAYVQRHGFLAMALQDIFQIIILWYVVIFPTFICVGVNYDVLFQDHFNITYKVIINDAIRPWKEVKERFNPFLILFLITSSFYLVFKTFKGLYNISKYWEIRRFFTYALEIQPSELANKKWHEVQTLLMLVQQKLHMCVHKNELTELDIYHRILRFKNYMVALVNKSVLPMKFNLPFWGEIVYFTSGLKYNYEMILFWGPGAPFANSWHLRKEYKSYNKRKELATILSRRIFIAGIINLLLAPVIFVWTLLYLVISHFALFRTDPGQVSLRSWSLYGRQYLRHFNELDHDFNARLNRGYRAAVKYMGLFWSPVMAAIAQFIVVISSGFLIFFVICAVTDEDTLAVQGVIKIMTLLGLVVSVVRHLIPDENMVRNPETLMTLIQSQTHYMNDSWKGQAHTRKVMDEFSQLFQYKLVYLINEMVSAIVCPFILIFSLRPNSLQIVDFLRNFTVTLEGIGDVCSFAQMDIKKHGHPEWNAPGNLELESPENKTLRAEFGKTELSLMNFKLTNPDWKVPDFENAFINNIRQNVNSMRRERGLLTGVHVLEDEDPMMTSSQALSAVGQPNGFQSVMLSSIAPASEYSSMFVTDGGFSHHHVRPTDLHLPVTLNSQGQGQQLQRNQLSGRDLFSSNVIASGAGVSGADGVSGGG
ncbi:hypothetical protein HELRODRAFT_95975, partial [Helobdella robusta]|uniref:Autophagy-related protein 9 n=1 Tax=Helobdella robusta TaxID=6412 RepID=T1G994_HELRO